MIFGVSGLSSHLISQVEILITDVVTRGMDTQITQKGIPWPSFMLVSVHRGRQGVGHPVKTIQL